MISIFKRFTSRLILSTHLIQLLCNIPYYVYATYLVSEKVILANFLQCSPLNQESTSINTCLHREICFPIIAISYFISLYARKNEQSYFTVSRQTVSKKKIVYAKKDRVWAGGGWAASVAGGMRRWLGGPR